MFWNREMVKTAAKAEMKQAMKPAAGVVVVYTLLVYLLAAPMYYVLWRIINAFSAPGFYYDSLNIIYNIMDDIMKWLPFYYIIVIVADIFFFYPLMVGMISYFIKAPYGDRSFQHLFSCFRSGQRYWSAVKAMLLREFYLFLWILLPLGSYALGLFFLLLEVYPLGILFFVGFFPLLIPICKKIYEYFMVPYIAADNPQLRPTEVIATSKKLTYGEKMNLFVLGLSFLGWLLLVSFGSSVLGLFPGVFGTVLEYIVAFAGGIVLSVYQYHSFAQVYFVLRYRHATQGAQAGGVGYPQAGYNAYQAPGTPVYPQQNYWQQQNQQQPSQWQQPGYPQQDQTAQQQPEQQPEEKSEQNHMDPWQAPPSEQDPWKDSPPEQDPWLNKDDEDK